jgi:hypothetical protein
VAPTVHTGGRNNCGVPISKFLGAKRPYRNAVPATISTKLAFSLVGKSHLRLGISANMDVRPLGFA